MPLGSAISSPDSAGRDGISTLSTLIAAVCLLWYVIVVMVCLIGMTQLRRYYSNLPRASLSAADASSAPHITIIRPVKGLEPSLHACLASTFQQTYPRERLTICLCVASASDPALPTLRALVNEYKATFDVRLYIEEEEDGKGNGDDERRGRLGPNPKIRNMSRAYAEAKGDIIWIVDCNVWVGKGVAGRMVDILEGRNGRKNKFVHQLPLVVDVQGEAIHSHTQNEHATVASTNSSSSGLAATSRTPTSNNPLQHILRVSGGRLEEMFMSSSHAKFYTAINTVLIAPCIVGKSNMFRRSHLNAITPDGSGIDFFSYNICEDHLIGDLLWRTPVPASLLSTTTADHYSSKQRWGNHALLFGDLAIQPMARMSVSEYVARRVRWLRVRKFTVTLATLVEPGTESFLCSAFGAFALTHLRWLHGALGLAPSWSTAGGFWLLSVAAWCVADRWQYNLLHAAHSVEGDPDTPEFARAPRGGLSRRRLGEWLPAWLAREALAFPVWFWAVWGGVGVVWRGKRLWVGMDMRVHEYECEGKGKTRVD